MPVTYELISSNVLSSSAASVTFSAIPATYTDLVLRLNARTNYASTRDNIWLTVNSSATGYSETVLYGFTGTAASLQLSTQTKWSKIYTNASTSTASTFSSVELYFPSYSGSAYKVMSGANAVEGNITTSGTILAATADLWQSTSAITSITMVPEAGTSFDSGSSFYLYGIKNS